jgi:hypothetical protein
MTTNPTVPRSVNVVVRALLQSPLLHRVMSHNTMLLSVTGRASGRIYRVPISYSRDENDVVCFTDTDSTWWKNLRGGAAVTMLVRGRRRPGTADVVTGPAVVEHLAQHLRLIPRDARYHGVRLGPDRQPDPTDLARTAHTTVMVRINELGPDGKPGRRTP